MDDQPRFVRDTRGSVVVLPYAPSEYHEKKERIVLECRHREGGFLTGLVVGFLVCLGILALITLQNI